MLNKFEYKTKGDKVKVQGTGFNYYENVLDYCYNSFKKCFKTKCKTTD